MSTPINKKKFISSHVDSNCSWVCPATGRTTYFSEDVITECLGDHYDKYVELYDLYESIMHVYEVGYSDSIGVETYIETIIDQRKEMISAFGHTYSAELNHDELPPAIAWGVEDIHSMLFFRNISSLVSL